MIRTMLKLAAYSKAPRATFAVLHPEEAFQLRKLPYDLEHAYAPRITAAVAVAVAFPLGILVGRRLERRAQRRRGRLPRPRLGRRLASGAASRHLDVTITKRPAASRA